MQSLYEILKTSKLGAGSAPDMYTALWGKAIAGGGSAIEYTGAVPVTIRANGEPLLAWTISGNMQQTGTPSPTTPIQPQECGEKMAQLIPELFQGGVSTADGSFTNSLSRVRTDYISVESGKTYAVNSGNLYLATGCYYNNGVFRGKIDEVIGATQTASFTVPENVNQIAIGFRTADGTTNITPSDLQNYMLNEGSTALPYEPYGYKLDIISGNTTTPVYLGEVESTRRIYKYEFTGSETWSAGTENYYSFVPQTYGDGVPYSAIICSHCSNATINNTGKAVFFKKTDFPDITTGEELKQFCADQYSAGTPVTVWYVLATPTTGIVNEPIRKIGDYADTISNVAEIPTTAGEQTFDVDTTLKPSEVYIKYRGG